MDAPHGGTPSPGRAPRDDDDALAHWRESASRAATRAYEAAYGREIPDASQGMRWRLRPRAAAAAAGAVALVAGIGWWATRDVTVQMPGAAASPATSASPLAPWGVEPSFEPVTALVVQISGAVGEPGLVEIPPGSRVADAVDAAGGLTGDADLASVNLARDAVDGEHVHVPSVGEQSDTGGQVSLNTATAAELEDLPGVGPVLAERIVTDREANGPFTSLDDVQRVSGVGPSLVAQWEGLAGV
ncbi:helix-hairpin-helix domain-containing protein [Demequina sp.]|uniref:helix-hairpin-helix domain-containing protein n=1 Tax=Demequina sp. TaxID=2050685 RepID=UPI003A8964C4